MTTVIPGARTVAQARVNAAAGDLPPLARATHLLRSLPPTALRPENDVHQFLTAADVRVGASITPPWFGRPGGGIRFTLQQPETGLRDLVVSGRLQRIQIVEAP